MRKISTVLLIVSLLLLVILISSGGFIFYLLSTIRNDAFSINNAGMVRGNIQRLVKNELQGIEKDNIIETINEKINTNKDMVTEREYLNSVYKLQAQWRNLEKLIENYRKSPSAGLSYRVLTVSEKLWELANENTAIIQQISERKVRNFYLYFAFFALNIIVAGLVLVIINRYVKKKLEVNAHFDRLTGLYNRASFMELLKIEVEKAARYNAGFVFLYFDIDHFKKVNDTYGHPTGDYVLAKIADLIRECIRSSDIFARIGGEEFCIIAWIDTILEGRELAEKVRSVVAEHHFKDVGTVTVSIGLTSFEPGDSGAVLIDRADNALYRAKNGGRNRVETG